MEINLASQARDNPEGGCVQQHEDFASDKCMVTSGDPKQPVPRISGYLQAVSLAILHQPGSIIPSALGHNSYTNISRFSRTRFDFLGILGVQPKCSRWRQAQVLWWSFKMTTEPTWACQLTYLMQEAECLVCVEQLHCHSASSKVK
jgi:hypothetical protein